MPSGLLTKTINCTTTNVYIMNVASTGLITIKQLCIAVIFLINSLLSVNTITQKYVE